MIDITGRSIPQFPSWPRSDRLFVAVVVLSTFPLWFSGYLPMVDIPQHAAQIVALQQMWDGNATFTQVFEINWFTPYLLGYLVLYLVSLLLPITVATQAVVSLTIISVPILTGHLLRIAGADERWKWLAIPGGFSFAFYWGFLSFMVAVPFALLFLIQAIRFARAPSLANAAVVAALSVFLFFCHIIALGFASLAALGSVFGGGFRTFKEMMFKALPFAAPLPLIVVWLAITYSSEPVAQNAPTVYGSVVQRLIMLMVQPAGLDSFSPVICSIVAGSVVLLPLLGGSRFSRRPERWLPFALGLTAFLTVPAFVLNTGFFYERLGVFLVPLWLMAWDRPADQGRRLDWIALAVVMVWLFSNTARFAAFARETESFKNVMEAVEPGRTVASMVFDSSSPLFATPVYLHFPSWYQATHLGIVDFNFADFYSQPARYAKHAGARLNDLLAWYPAEFRWELHGGEKYDYFIVKADVDVSNEIFKEKRAAVELVARSHWWWLYRNLERDSHAISAKE